MTTYFKPSTEPGNKSLRLLNREIFWDFLLYSTLPSAAPQIPLCRRMLGSNPESIATLPPFGPIEGHKWFFQISCQWESQKNRFEFFSFGKIQFLPPCIWDLPFMSYRLRTVATLALAVRRSAKSHGWDFLDFCPQKHAILNTVESHQYCSSRACRISQKFKEILHILHAPWVIR